MAYKLEVGVEIIHRRNGGATGTIARIDRVTEKRAFAGDVQFMREGSGSTLRVIREEKWATHTYEIATPESIEATRAANRLSVLRNRIEDKCGVAGIKARTAKDAEALQTLWDALDKFINS